jgi:S-adenosylmethionine decarboxylase
MDTQGRHVIAELDGCDAAILSDPVVVRRLLLEAARRTNATVLNDAIFAFNNGGVSGFVLLAESHVSIHTWPEHHYAAIDIYTCGNYTMPQEGCDYLADALGATRVRTTSMTRGIPASGGYHDHRVLPHLESAATSGFIPLNQSA